MTHFPWDSKDVRGDTDNYADNKDSNVVPNLRGPSPEITRLDEWSTSRLELWCFYLYYVVRLFFFCIVSFPFSIVGQRATMDCPDSTSVHLNSRISSTSLVMTRASHPSRNHAAAGPIACYRIWGASVIVRPSPVFFISHIFVAHKLPAFIFIFSAMPSQFDCSPHQRDNFCHSGGLVADDWRLGGLWDVEVRRG